jgi:hypothetical protein
MTDAADIDRKPKDATEYVSRWVEAVKAAKADEKNWRDEACKAVEAFRGEKSSASRDFNLYHSNIEILAPAIFNSVPVPDVRRRFADSDPAGKFAADIIERSLSFSMDSYDFDQRVKLGVYDMAITGRGVMRVRYEPETEMDERLGVEAVTYQTAPCEYVPWDRFTVGPAITWDDVPWIEFDHYLSKDQVEKLAGAEMAAKLPYNYTAHGEDGEKSTAENIPDAFKRVYLMEIWDKRDRKVIFVCPDWHDEVVREADDILKLESFFPVPRPMYAVAPVGKLCPVSPITIYRGLLEELNEVTRRISKLVKQLRPRGGYLGTGLDMKPMAEADDGELVPLQGSEMSLAAGAIGIDKAITWFPMEPTVLALRELLAQRDAIKQTIYEVTGIADIMRGASDAGETASAQKLKAQFGSVRVRALQMEVARFVRDLLRLKATIMAKLFEPAVLMEMTGVKLLPQAQKQQLMQMAQANPEMAEKVAQQQPELVEMVKGPSMEEVFGLLRSDKMRSYRIDIETDSTIRGDLMRNQEQMAAFLQGTGQYLAAIGPMVKEGAIPKEAAVELYAAFARQFQLGKSAEDALDNLAKSASQPQADPAAAEAAKGQAEAQATMQVEGAKLQAQQQLEAAKLEMEQMKLQATAQAKAQEIELKRYEIDLQDQRERDKADKEINMRASEAAMNAQLKRETAAMSAKPTTTVSLDAGSSMGVLTDTLSKALSDQNGRLEQTQMMVADALKLMSAPKRIVRGPDGRAAGVEAIS